MKNNKEDSNKFKHIPTSSKFPSLANFHSILSQEEMDTIRIKEALHDFGHINTLTVDVKLEDNVVHLTGNVSSEEQKDDAETIAWMCMPDAVNVINNIIIGGGSEYKEELEF
jgi:hypothetical protein